MHITKLECRDFRCLREVRFAPCSGLNVLRGANAQGKTTLLEAVLFTTTARSHRTNTESELARHESDQFHIRLEGAGGGGPVVIECHWWQGAKRYKVNGVSQTRVSDILGRLNVVFFCPEDVGLVRESASVRRRFLDMELSQISPGYLAALQQYRVVLRQRNELLRSHHPDGALIEVWDEQLARHGGVMMEERRSFVESLAVHARAAHAGIAESEALILDYRPDIREGESFGEVLTRTREGDVKRGLTGRGPHRDDIGIHIDGHAARSHGSQGQQKTAALALKLAEVALVRERCGSAPVLMLDEVLAELDASRSRRLLETIGDDVQCIMTTTALEAGAGGTGAAAEFRIEGGSLEAI